MNAKRLLKLADFLETVPRRKFDLSSWVRSAPSKPEQNREGSCGFAGCAMGWAVHAKLFRGLKFERDEDPDEFNRGPEYQGRTGFPAVAALFDIGEYSAQRLFVDVHYPNFHATPKQVAKRIREFVADHNPESP